ncbi:hypothetical protein BGZ65_001126 [Modicella reniformis]|uniref:BLOC-1-related complex subunit 5 n=1 Tax=Modicella reniformis TaxID=1440133 RepID=A0A9P6INW4_9FUNG|nr:hypothetical protein BGZ65_001126 [Modicella reniformis]
MDQTQGIITVVDESQEHEDDALVALRRLPKVQLRFPYLKSLFEPLMTPEQPSHFSLASVFGTLSASTDPKHVSCELAFNPGVLVDILVQINSHNKKCAQDIQGYQRALVQKTKALDDYTMNAVQNLTNIHHQAKTQSDHLLSVQALIKQANTTTALLHGIVHKITALSAALPADAEEEEELTAEKYPNLYRYLHETPRNENRRSTEGSSSLGSASKPSGLALLGHGTAAKTRQLNTQQNYPARTTAMFVPKARASMALASSALAFLPMFASSEKDENQHLASRSLEESSSQRQISRGGETDNLEERTSNDLQRWQQTRPRVPQQQITQKASDNLRRLATKQSGSPPV